MTRTPHGSNRAITAVVPRCESCQSTEELARRDEGVIVVFCHECLASTATLPFPEYYRDIGGEG